MTLGWGEKVKYYEISVTMSILKIFMPTLVRVLTNKRKYIEQNFDSVAGVMPQGVGLGGAGESKTLAWGFAMAPHRLCILVLFVFTLNVYLSSRLTKF